MGTVQSDDLAGRRDRAPFARHLFLACTVVFCLGLLVYASDPAGAESVWWKLFLLLAAVALFFGMVGYLARAAVSRQLRVPELAPLLGPALVVACTVAVWSADLPIVVRWQFSEHSFEETARQVRDGADPQAFEGRRLGLYHVDDSGHPTSGVFRNASGIYFATSPPVGHCSSRAGFAQLTGAPPAGSPLHHLSGDWYWFCFDSGGTKTVVPDHPIGR